MAPADASPSLRIYLIVLQIGWIAILLSAFSCGSLYAQATQEDGQLGSGPPKPESGRDTQRQPVAAAASSGEAPQSNSPGEEKQPKRILWIIPNYRAVSANTELPPLSTKGKFWLATEDSFDYSSVVLAGIIAGISQAGNDTPEFHHGAAAYGRYFWHTYTDEVVGNYFTEALLPIATRQDPRYYTLGRSGGGFLHRTGYALTRLVITRTDSGNNTFNVSEVLGNAVGAGISDFYYPRAERTWGKTGEKWLLQLGIDAVFDVAKEFWPDIDRRIFHGKYGAGSSQ